MKTSNIFKLIIAIAVSEIAGVIGSVFTMLSVVGWYSTLVKPAPAAWLFLPYIFWVSFAMYLNYAIWLLN